MVGRVAGFSKSSTAATVSDSFQHLKNCCALCLGSGTSQHVPDLPR